METKTIKKRNRNILFFCVITVIFLLIFHYCGNVTGDKPGGLVYGSAEEEYIDDETPLGAANKIVFPGFSTKVIKYGPSKQLTLQNPKKNTVDFVYTIEYEGEEIYESEPIPPGESQKWNLHEVFTEKGRYEITIYISPFDASGAEKNGFKQNFTFEIA